MIRRLELRNYGKFANLDLELGAGFISIIGLNGAGKSLLLDSIGYALYGLQAVRHQKDGLKRRGAPAGEPCFVRVTFTLGNKEYVVERGLKGAALAAYGYVKQGERTLVNGADEVTAWAGEKLGLPWAAFSASVYARQNEIDALARLRPAERVKMITRMLGIERIDRVVAEVRKERRFNQELIASLEGQALSVEQAKEDVLERQMGVITADMALEKARETLKDRQMKSGEATRLFEEQKKLRQMHESLLLELRKAENACERAAADKARLTNELEQLREIGRRLEGEPDYALLLETAEKRRVVLENFRRAFQERRNLMEELAAVEEMLAETQDRADKAMEEAASLEGAGEALSRGEKLLSDLEAEKEALLASLAELEAQRLSFARQAAELEKTAAGMASLEAGGECPVCHRPLEEGEMEDYLVHLREEAETARIQASELGRQKQTMEDNLARVKQRITQGHAYVSEWREKVRERERQLAVAAEAGGQAEKLRERVEKLCRRLAALPEVVFDEEEYARVQEEVSSLSGQARDQARLRGMVARLPEVATALEEVTAQMEETLAAKEKMARRVAGLGYDESRYAVAEQEAFRSLEALGEARRAVEQAEGDLRLQEQALGEAERLLAMAEQNEAKLNELRVQVAYAEEADRFLGQLRENLIGRIRPNLRRLTADYFRRMTDGKYADLEITEQYELLVYEDGVAYPLYEFSGGENVLASLCQRLAISDVLARQMPADGQLGVIVLDEVLGSQDGTRRGNILRVLREILEHSFDQVIVISHLVEEIKQVADVTFLVEEQADGTSIVRSV